MDTLAHGIGVTNRFELFYNEDVDPLEILRQQEEEKQRRKVEKTTVKDKKPIKAGKVLTSAPPKKPLESVTNKQVKSNDQVEVPNKPRGGKPNERPPRAGGNYHESKEGEKNARNKDDQFFNPDQRDRDGGEFRRGRGGGGYRGRGGRGGDRGGSRTGGGGGYVPGVEGRTRRMFDRHSGSDKTGVRPTEKREGSGPGNWGDMRSEFNQQKNESTWDDGFEGGDKIADSTWNEGEANESTTFGEGEDAPKTVEGSVETTEAKDGEQTEEQMQEAVKEMTLDEYKKEQEAKRVVPKFNLRKPGEGEDDKQWKKGYVLKKKPKEEEEDHDDEEEDVEDDDFARKAQAKVLLDFQFNFSDSRRGTRGRGRGGRGGPRGGARDNLGPRDAPRDDRVRENRGPRGGRDPAKPKAGQQAPRVDDINDFPSLASA